MMPSSEDDFDDWLREISDRLDTAATAAIDIDAELERVKRRAAGSGHAPEAQATHRTLVAVDIERHGNPQQLDAHRASVRRGLYQALDKAFQEIGIDWSHWRIHDTGDGVLMLSPPDLHTDKLATNLPTALAATLREHNKKHPPTERIRLRMAMHAGEIDDALAPTGAAVTQTHQLLGSSPLQAALTESPVVLAVVVSSWFYENVVRQHPASAPETYHPVQVTTKDANTTAWISLPDVPHPARAPERLSRTSPEIPDARQIIQRIRPNAAIRVSAGSDQITYRPAGDKIQSELLEIPRGRGMRAEDVAERIGTGLRAACGVTAADSPVVVRRKVGQRLVDLCERLPNDLKISVLAGLGLHSLANQQFLQDRLTWAARQFNRDHPRAAARRMKTAVRILAEQLNDGIRNPTLHDGWHTTSLRALVRMDIDPPSLVEDRIIVATSDNLDEIKIRLLAEAPENRVLATALYGGEITRTERITSSQHQFVLRLPQPLHAGEHHEYGMRFTGVPRTVMKPFYVLTPLQPCERFTLRVRFGVDVPKRIWRVNGIPARAIDEFEPSDDVLEPDQFGEVALEFTPLHQGLSYGIHWTAQ